MLNLPIILETKIPEIVRKTTGLWSVDYALRNPRTNQIGMPLSSIIELYGREHSGKSTFGEFLAGSVNPDGRVGIMDTENSIDMDYLPLVFATSGFHGEIYIIPKADAKGKPRHHSIMATELADCLTDERFNAIMLDSVGMYISTAEAEGVIGDANMGRTARDMTQWVKRVASHMVSYPDPAKIAIMINHKKQTLGGMAGSYTPGGRAKSHAAGVRIDMFRKDNKFEYGAFQAKISVQKLRQGGTDRDREGNVFIIPGVGVAKGMTAVMDCLMLEEAKREAYVKIKSGDEMVSSGFRIGQLVKADLEHDEKPFAPFHEILEGYYERASANIAGNGETVSGKGENNGGEVDSE